MADLSAMDYPIQVMQDLIHPLVAFLTFSSTQEPGVCGRLNPLNIASLRLSTDTDCA